MMRLSVSQWILQYYMSVIVVGRLTMYQAMVHTTTSALRSASDEKIFIEVKGRAQAGAVVLTAAEADKLRQLGERAWLYIVTLCRTESPKLHLIQNPMAELTPEMLYRNVQFLIEENDWRQKGVEADGLSAPH